MRAFARALGMSPALLSLILSGKQEVSRRNIEKMAAVLELGPRQTNALAYQCRMKKLGSVLPGAVEVHGETRSLEIFTVLSEWYHFAILSLLELPAASKDPRWIARKLGIAASEAKLAFERMRSLGIIAERKGKWVQVADPIRIADDAVPSGAARKFQRQLLQKAIESLENDPPSRRDVTSMTFSMNPSDLPYAVEEITRFRRALTDTLDRNPKKTAVYSLTVQLFPMTKET